MIKKILTITALLLVCSYLVAALTFLNRKPHGAVCQGVECIIKDSIRSSFINAREVELLLKKNRLHPKGEIIDSIKCRNIENCLRKDPRIEQAECYKTPLSQVCIEIVQRLPILRVMSLNGDNYFVDSKGKIMPHAQCAAYTPIATGYIDKQMAGKELYELALFLQENEFWNNQIQQIHLTQNKEIELVPRVGNHIIFLGKPELYEEKLNRLEEFYKKALNKVGWNKYSRISLEFNNQVICTKKEK